MPFAEENILSLTRSKAHVRDREREEGPLSSAQGFLALKAQMSTAQIRPSSPPSVPGVVLCENEK